MPTDTRSRRAIRAVTCPFCLAPVGLPCIFTPAERKRLGSRLRSLPIHKVRRLSYQLKQRLERA